MTVPVLTFFSCKGGIGQTTLAYHIAWMLADLDYRVLICDLDPQANLTTALLDEEQQEELWGNGGGTGTQTVAQCIPCIPVGGRERPYSWDGSVNDPSVQEIAPNLVLIPGDPALAAFENDLYAAWERTSEGEFSLWNSDTDSFGAEKAMAVGERNEEPLVSLQTLKAFSDIMQSGARQTDATIVLVDTGPTLGAINRAVLIGTDHVIVPLGPDLISLQSLQYLGPILNQWRRGWQQRKERWGQQGLSLPDGSMQPIGYTARQFGFRLTRPITPCDQWVNQIPREYARNVLEITEGAHPGTLAQDEEHFLAIIRRYPSLTSMAHEARKPIFHLTAADGAMGSHAAAAYDARREFDQLTRKIVQKMALGSPDA